MRRTQLYLDDHLWAALHAAARSRQTTISELVRESLRERYLGDLDERRKAMERIVGIRRRRVQKEPAVEEVRRLRSGSRLDRIEGE
jgi:hypothetical protein